MSVEQIAGIGPNQNRNVFPKKKVEAGKKGVLLVQKVDIIQNLPSTWNIKNPCPC
jgi:hypothetical protein